MENLPAVVRQATRMPSNMAFTAWRAMRRRGKIDKRTSFGQSFEKRKREYVADLGGEVVND